MSDRIETVIGRRAWDSRGRPTVELEVHSVAGAAGRAIAPAGAASSATSAEENNSRGGRASGDAQPETSA